MTSSRMFTPSRVVGAVLAAVCIGLGTIVVLLLIEPAARGLLLENGSLLEQLGFLLVGVLLIVAVLWFLVLLMCQFSAVVSHHGVSVLGFCTTPCLAKPFSRVMLMWSDVTRVEHVGPKLIFESDAIIVTINLLCFSPQQNEVLSLIEEMTRKRRNEH